MKIFLLFMLVTASVSALAQISIGPEVGVNLTNSRFVDNNIPTIGTHLVDTRVKPGIKAGVIVNILIAREFFIQTGGFYSTKGYKNSYDLANAAKSNTSINYVEIPIDLGYQYSIHKIGKIFVTAGPYLGYALAGTLRGESFLNGISLGKEKIDITFGSNEDDAKHLDIGLNLSADFKLPIGLYLKTQYGLGLFNFSNRNNTTIRNRVFSFSLGYIIFSLRGK